MKAGDAIASVFTPIVRTLGLPCIDPETKELRPDSPCAKRKAMLNDFSDAFWDKFFNKPKE